MASFTLGAGRPLLAWLGSGDLLAAILGDAALRARTRIATSSKTYRRLAAHGDARLATLKARPEVVDALDTASRAGERLYQGIQHGVDELHDASEEALGHLYRHAWSWRARLTHGARWWAHTLTASLTRPLTTAPSKAGGVSHHPVMTGPSSAVTRFRLPSGETVVTRPLQHHDQAALAAAAARMSEASRYQRFHHRFDRLPTDMLTALTDIDHYNHEALIALSADPARLPNTDSAEILGLARFTRHPRQPHTAELALGVADAWQRRGMATLLLSQLAQRASALGIEQFTATVLPDNTPAIALLHHLGTTKLTRDSAALHARIRLDDWQAHGPY